MIKQYFQRGEKAMCKKMRYLTINNVNDLRKTMKSKAKASSSKPQFAPLISHDRGIFANSSYSISLLLIHFLNTNNRLVIRSQFQRWHLIILTWSRHLIKLAYAFHGEIIYWHVISIHYVVKGLGSDFGWGTFTSSINLLLLLLTFFNLL